MASPVGSKNRNGVLVFCFAASILFAVLPAVLPGGGTFATLLAMLCYGLVCACAPAVLVILQPAAVFLLSGVLLYLSPQIGLSDTAMTWQTSLLAAALIVLSYAPACLAAGLMLRRCRPFRNIMLTVSAASAGVTFGSIALSVWISSGTLTGSSVSAFLLSLFDDAVSLYSELMTEMNIPAQQAYLLMDALKQARVWYMEFLPSLLLVYCELTAAFLFFAVRGFARLLDRKREYPAVGEFSMSLPGGILFAAALITAIFLKDGVIRTVLWNVVVVLLPGLALEGLLTARWWIRRRTGENGGPSCMATGCFWPIAIFLLLLMSSVVIVLAAVFIALLALVGAADCLFDLRRPFGDGEE